MGVVKDELAEMGSLLTHVGAAPPPLEKVELPPDVTSSKKRGTKLEQSVEKASRKKKGAKKSGKSDSESEIDLGAVPNFGADFQEILQDTLDKKLPSFFRRKTSIQRDEKRVEELVMKGHDRANANRESVISLLDEKKKERKEMLEAARKQLKKEGKLGKDFGKEKDKDRSNLNLELKAGKDKSKRNKEGNEMGKGTKEKKKKKVKDGEENGEKPKKEEKKGTLEKDKKKKRETEKTENENKEDQDNHKKKKHKDKPSRKENPDVEKATPIYTQVVKNKDSDIK